MLGHCSLQSLALSAATTLLMGVSFASGSNAVEVGPHQHSPRWQPIHHSRAGLSKRASRHRKRKCSARSPSSSVDAGLAGTNLTVSTGSKVHPVAASGSASASPSISTKSVHKSRTPLYDWTDYSNTAYGVNLGSWLMLERWMALDLFNTNAPNAVDDYTFAQALGDRTAAVLKPYWESWVKDADIDRIAATGANMIRIPVGYWAFHKNVFDDPFPALQGQQAQITRVMKRIAKHGMYAIIDLHSMPGRASTDQCNGRLNGPVQFYDPEFQPYNDAVIRAVYKYIIKSPYRNNIAAIGALNEPDACVSSRNETRIAALGDFYQRSYDFLAKQKDRVPLIVHHGYCGLPQWNSFVSDKDPNYLIMEDHPYPGTFASTNGDADALGGVCYKAQEYSQYAVPVVVTEWTLRLKTGGPDLVPKMFAQQVSAYAASGGSVFWSHKGDNDADDGWNYLKLVENGTIQVPSNGTSLMDWAKGLGGTCTGLSTPPWAK